MAPHRDKSGHWREAVGYLWQGQIVGMQMAYELAHSKNLERKVKVKRIVVA